MSKASLVLPPKLIPVFNKPLGSYRYRGAYGGRGSGKSYNFAKMAAVYGFMQPIRILCTREFQSSIKESFHAEIKRAINSEPWLEAAYDVGVDYIRGKNGTEFIFRGLRNNFNSIKSLADIHLTIVEEAEDVPENAWVALEATVFRTKISELWPIWNPRDKDSPVDKRFIQSPPDNGVIVKMNWQDNPFFPEALNDLRLREFDRLDKATYGWIWEGDYLEMSDIRVFHNWRVEECEPTFNDDLYYGADWGFSQDPTTLLRCWVDEFNKKIYVDYQIDGVGIDTVDLPRFFEQVPRSKEHTIIGDSARPETISHMNNNGYHVEPSIKGKGSVESGVNWLRGHEIIIHPRCKLLEKELRLYSYKVDKGGNILPKVDDKAGLDHCFIGETLITTNIGKIPIKDIKVGDLVLTRAGFKPVLKVFNNGIKKVNTYTFPNGSSLTCTDTHNIITKHGKVNIKDLSKNNVIYYEGDTWKYIEAENQRFAYLKAKSTEDFQTMKTDLTAFISEKAGDTKKQNICIGKFIKNIMAIFLKVSMFTIKTTTPLIIILITWLLLTVQNTCLTMLRNLRQKTKSLLKKTLINKGHLRHCGINQRKVGDGTKNTMKSTKKNCIKKLLGNVRFAKPLMKPIKRTLKRLFVQTNVSLHTAAVLALMMLIKCVNGVILRLEPTNIERPLHAQDRADCVYDIMVKDQHEYFANGILVSNCIDGLRYSLESHIRSDNGGGFYVI